MSNPDWYRNLPRWAREAIDQLGHALIGGGPAALVGGLCTLALPGWASGLIGAIAGSFAMGAYELIQNVGDDTNDYLDMARDLGVGIATAIGVGLIIWAVA